MHSEETINEMRAAREAWERLKKRRTPNRSWRPVMRVRAAMGRLSRDKWLDPKECKRIAFALSQCCSSRPSWVADHALPDACMGVGMLFGEPPAFIWDEQYTHYLQALKGLKSNQSMSPELAILNLTIKGKKS